MSSVNCHQKVAQWTDKTRMHSDTIAAMFCTIQTGPTQISTLGGDCPSMHASIDAHIEFQTWHENVKAAQYM